MASTITPRPELLDTEPAKTLLSRVRDELAADFAPDLPVRISAAPGRLDVMGGIADYTGSMVCEMPLACAAAVASQPRKDRQLQVFSFNLLDEHKPFTLRIPIDALATQSAEALRREFAEPGRKWAAYLAGCLFVLHTGKWIDLLDPSARGLSLAAYSTVPMGAGVSSSAALEVATMMNLVDQFSIRDKLTPMQIAELCQKVENQIVGAPCGIMDQATSCLGEEGRLFRMICQPHEVLPPLRLPEGIRVLGINSNVTHDVGGPAYARTRCAAFMAHRMMLEQMREMGRAVSRELIEDPMHGYLANLDPEDYKRFFRPKLPEVISGSDFLSRYDGTIDAVTSVNPNSKYPVRHAADHHVLEARRVRRFAEFIEKASDATGRPRTIALDSAGHLMYGSHQSYTQDAMLGCDECDLLVQLVRRHEPAGFYGARITGGGSGGTVAILGRQGESTDAAIAEILHFYEKETGRTPQVLQGSRPGACHAGTAIA